MGVDHGGTGETSPPPQNWNGDANANCPPPHILSSMYKNERSGLQSTPKSFFSAGALPRTPLGDLTTYAPPDPFVGWRRDTPPHTRHGPTFGARHASPPAEVQPDLRLCWQTVYSLLLLSLGFQRPRSCITSVQGQVSKVKVWKRRLIAKLLFFLGNRSAESIMAMSECWSEAVVRMRSTKFVKSSITPPHIGVCSPEWEWRSKTEDESRDNEDDEMASATRADSEGDRVLTGTVQC